tara:strand:+ start:996 stop:2741 length:1746 start_codon:yes stop_codon:yes gene_type:complete
VARISEQIIESIRSKADIIDTISGYIQLKKRGRNFFGICPFHDEKTPSFSVNQDKQIYKCFGCGAGGGSINFIMEIEKLDFVEAIKYLGEKYGVQIDLHQSVKENSIFSQLIEINDIVSTYYMNNLFKQSNSDVLNHLNSRGISSETIKEFKLGYADNSYDTVLKGIQSKKFKSDAMKQSGLFINTKNGYIDRFRSRIMFTIQNTAGKTVAFAGRVYNSNDSAKYVNSPETPLYVKSNILYGLYKTKNEIIKSSRAIVVEGYLDLLQLYQAGIKNIVAVSGTSFTEQHAKLIKRYCNEVFLAYDGDNAGISSAIKAAYILMKHGVNVKIVPLPINKDPDDWVKNEGPEPFLNALENSLEVIDFEYKHKGEMKSSIELSQFIDKIINELKQIDDPIMQELQCKNLSRLCNVSEKNIIKKLSTISKKQYTTNKDNNKQNDSLKNLELVEQELIKLCFSADIDIRKLINERIDSNWIINDSNKKMFSVISVHLNSEAPPNPSILMNELKEKERKILAHLVINIDDSINANVNMAIDCLNRLEGYWLKHNLNVLRLKLRDNLSEELEIDLVSKINEIQTQLNNIS